MQRETIAMVLVDFLLLIETTATTGEGIEMIEEVLATLAHHVGKGRGLGVHLLEETDGEVQDLRGTVVQTRWRDAWIDVSGSVSGVAE
jgi:hypothetical protein